MMMAARGEFLLSEQIIHRIQSFLNGREAAQTTVLSKSWHQAWLTRPNLEFNRYDFYFDYDDDDDDEFLEFMEKTIQRYEESNLKIESFSLTMDMLNSSCETMMIKALGMGVTRLSLVLRESYASYCSLLPAEVFGCKDLVELSLSGCRIALDPQHQVQLPRLKALSLSYIRVESDDDSDDESDDESDEVVSVVSGLLSGCPLLEKLSLKVHDTISHPNLPKLRHLELRRLRINTSFFGDLSCKCPLMRDLSIHHCSFRGNLLISCPTIEYLNIEYLHIERNSIAKTVSCVEFDVPSIRKFKFKSFEILPYSLSFKSTNLREWESHLSIPSSCCVGTTGVIGLNKLLTDLRHSKIHLLIEVDEINVGNTRSFNNDVWKFNGLTLHQVEELTIDGMDYNISSFMGFALGFALFDGLFRLCRPKFVTQHNSKTSNPIPCVFRLCRPKFITTINRIPCVSDFLFKLFLRHGINHECSARSLDMYGLRHLEEVRAQIFYADVYTWRLITLDTWDALKDQKKIRFQLKWRDESQQVN
ncbi:Putative F-box/LRR-repeat protein [Striga hermonthica]|uniref:F-box/LRR-repeat protein n=1 Tax=Striga hermonthica TaxID=68872 RepID=A0A9N7RAZ9_STRHE|nr:Putative F-box/LRR-repeat protein [Striga hermonthica]